MAGVVVYGATPAGCAAAIAAARLGLTVSLLDPGLRVGGMTSGGLGHTDVGLEGRELGGITREFYNRVAEKYGGAPGTVCFDIEPHVAEAVYAAMLTEANVNITLGVAISAATVTAGGITSISVLPTAADSDHHRLRDPTAALPVAGRVFIDASYEGDLIALAGVPFTVGREGADQYNETDAGRLAPNNVLARYQFQRPLPHTTPRGSLLPMIYDGPIAKVGDADAKVQAYTYRPCMTKLAGGCGVPVGKPRAYDPSRWELFRRLLTSSRHSNLTAADFLYFAGPLGNKTGLAAKFDVGTNGAFSLDYIGASWAYPNATRAQRASIIDDHVQYTLEFLHFLSTDPAGSPQLRADVASYGWCADEFVDEGHFPTSALYVREARRMLGSAVFTEQDHVSSRTKPDTIGMGSYNMDCHMVERIAVNASWVLNEGWLTRDFPRIPFELPYSLMVPPRTKASNLLVPVAVSASHVAFAGLRLETTWSILGQAAGVAAAIAANVTASSVQDVSVPRLQALLRSQGQLLTLDEVLPAGPPTHCGQPA